MEKISKLKRILLHLLYCTSYNLTEENNVIATTTTTTPHQNRTKHSNFNGNMLKSTEYGKKANEIAAHGLIQRHLIQK